ncbi:2-nitropropane dioxygenase [Trametes meyenii]|nr:2-nitropropane dioxygenase [Trametes meyenii]
MQTVKTSLTSLLGIRVPVVSAAMAYASSAKLAAEVTRGGGFGFFHAAGTTAAQLREELRLARNSFTDIGNGPLPIGCGFIGWQLDAKETESKELVDIVVEGGVQAIWLSFGNDLLRWIQYIRASSAYAHSGTKPLLFVQVSSVEEALQAVNDWKVDVLIVQGNESGGHGAAAAPSTITFLSEVLAALPAGNTTPVLVSGGIANGTQVAAYLTAGAAGAVLGTRFLLTPESTYSPAHKAVLKAAKSSQTVRTLAFDDARGTNSWPEGIDGRGVRNKIVDDVLAGVDLATVRERFKKAVQEGDPEYLIVWSGQGISLIDEIRPAKEVVEELHADTVRALQRSQQLLA